VTPLRAAARVAAVATGIAVVLYLAASVALVLITDRANLQAVDQQLENRFTGPDIRRPFDVSRPLPDRGRGNFAPTVQWGVDSSGSVFASSPNAPELPSQFRHLQGPTTGTVGGVSMRLDGRAVQFCQGPRCFDGWLVQGESLNFVDRARQSLLLAEGIALLPVMLLVFGAALAIGRWSAQPIEDARRKLLAFSADASHELRTPLQVMEAEVSLALLRERDAGSYKTSLERTADEMKRMRALVDDLLWLARFDSRSRESDFGAVDLVAATAGSVARFRAVSHRRRQTLSLEPVQGSLPVITAPESWIDRLLGVLLDNACRYTPEGGQVRVRAGVAEGRAFVSVEDSGPGVPPPERGRIFERFHRAGGGGGGAGLGLSIGDAIVRATGGRWTVNDSPLGGASFMVTWPRARRGADLTAPEPGPQLQGDQAVSG